MNTVKMRRCTKCGRLRLKSLKHFHAHKGCRDGLNTQCKDCVCRRASNWHSDNRDYHLEQMRVHQANTAALMSHREATKRWRTLHPREAAISASKTRLLHPEPHRSCEAKRRAAKRTRFIEHVNGQILYERDEGICGICNEPVSRKKFEIDHVVSLASGGDHSYENTQIAHPICNRRKGG